MRKADVVGFIFLDLTFFDALTEEVLVVVSASLFNLAEFGVFVAFAFAGFLVDMVLVLTALPLLGITEVVVDLAPFFGLLEAEETVLVEVVFADVDLVNLADVDVDFMDDVEMVDDEDFRVDDVEVDEVFEDELVVELVEATGVGLGRAGAFSPGARLTYVLNRQPAPQY